MFGSGAVESVEGGKLVALFEQTRAFVCAVGQHNGHFFLDQVEGICLLADKMQGGLFGYIILGDGAVVLQLLAIIQQSLVMHLYEVLLLKFLLDLRDGAGRRDVHLLLAFRQLDLYEHVVRDQLGRHEVVVFLD